MNVLTIGAAAEALGVSTQYVRNIEADANVFPIRDSSGRRLYTPEQVNALVDFLSAQRKKRQDELYAKKHLKDELAELKRKYDQEVQELVVKARGGE